MSKKPEPPIFLKRFHRKPAQVDEDNLVSLEPLKDGCLPLVIKPREIAVNLVEWAASSKSKIELLLSEHGAILFRGFNPGGLERFKQFIAATSEHVLDYRERSSPRTEVRRNIYTSTDYPADREIFLHNENSYQNTWPLKLYFYCDTAPAAGGETPLANVQQVLNEIRPEIAERFVQKNIMYVRNFNERIGLTWQEVFRTDSKQGVEEYCNEADIQCEWRGANGLRTQQVRAPFARHPKLGTALWFNHAAFFHVSTLDALIRSELTASFREEDLPANSYYGDHTAIESEITDHLREAYRKAVIVFPWERGDVLLIDNMLTAHGRRPFSGERRIFVGMADPCNREIPPH